THAIGAHHEPGKVFEIVLRSLEDNLGVDFCCICRYQAEPELLTVASVGEKSRARAQELGIAERAQFELPASSLKRCVRGDLVYEPAIDESTLPFPARLASLGLRSLVASPLTVENEVFGVLLVAKRESGAFTSDDCEFLRQLSSH